MTVQLSVPAGAQCVHRHGTTNRRSGIVWKLLGIGIEFLLGVILSRRREERFLVTDRDFRWSFAGGRYTASANGQSALLDSLPINTDVLGGRRWA